MENSANHEESPPIGNMAEVTTPTSTEGSLSSVSTNSIASVVAPPKFVFGSGMSKRVVKRNVEEDESDTSEQEEQTAGIDFLEYASAAVKRAADSDDDSGESFPDFSFVPKKIKKQDTRECKGGSVLRPSALSTIAQKLAHPKTDETADTVKQDDKSAKTHGESSDSHSSLETSTSVLRPHLIDTPAPLNSGSQSQNYFQQFLAADTSSLPATESQSAFVFGQNIRERVTVEMRSKETLEASTTLSEKATSPKSLADVADSASNPEVDAETGGSSIAAAAQRYEIEHSPPKKNLAQIDVMTGEEGERNVIQLGCRLFVFCKESHSWLGRGRVALKLNDHCMFDEEGVFHSRLVARTQGNLRLVLNTKLWPDMVVEKASDKAIRVSAMEDGNVNLYLIMAASKDALQLYTAIDRRIQTLKREKATEKTVDGTGESIGKKANNGEKQSEEEEDLKDTKTEKVRDESEQKETSNDEGSFPELERQTDNDV